MCWVCILCQLYLDKGANNNILLFRNWEVCSDIHFLAILVNSLVYTESFSLLWKNRLIKCSLEYIPRTNQYWPWRVKFLTQANYWSLWWGLDKNSQLTVVHQLGVIRAYHCDTASHFYSTFTSIYAIMVKLSEYKLSVIPRSALITVLKNFRVNCCSNRRGRYIWARRGSSWCSRRVHFWSDCG